MGDGDPRRKRFCKRPLSVAPGGPRLRGVSARPKERPRGEQAMTEKTSSPETTRGEALAAQLRELGVRRGVLVRMAQRGQLLELRCEMPTCYCHKGRSHFEQRTHPQRSVWAPSADHYPLLQADGGKLVASNVRLAHVHCNQEDYVWRGRIRRMLEKDMSLEEIAQKLTQQGIRRPHGSSKWTAKNVRKAFVS
jgi:hypothetical protein